MLLMVSFVTQQQNFCDATTENGAPKKEDICSEIALSLYFDSTFCTINEDKKR